MKKALTATVVGLILGICVSAQAGYQTQVKVTPSTAPQWFTVEFEIKEVDQDGKAEVLSSPMLLVKAGREGKTQISDPQEQSDVLCTALIKVTDQGAEATTTITLKDHGAEMLNTSQKVIIKN